MAKSKNKGIKLFFGFLIGGVIGLAVLAWAFMESAPSDVKREFLEEVGLDESPLRETG